jgi:Cu(I)/Ag(I) efflux system membrane fusion protein
MRSAERDPTVPPPDLLPEGEEAPPPGVRTASIVRWLLIGVMALAAAASLLVALGGRSGRGDGAGGTADAAVQYYCPMHPQIVQDHPGECPICSMTLVPRPAGAGAETTAAPPGPGPGTGAADGGVPGLAPIVLAPERVQLIGLRTAPVVRGPLTETLRTVGFVAPDETRQAVVQPRFAGWIETLPVSQTGQHVRRGEVLATIYSPELLATQQELRNARRWAADDAAGRFADGLAAAARRRLELLGIAPEDVRALERGDAARPAVPLRAPIDGWVTEKTAVAGRAVEPGMPLFALADLSTVWVQADVYEPDIGRIAVGAPARFTTAAHPGTIFDGRVEFLMPTVDPATRTLRVRLAFPNPDLRLRPGMYGDVALGVAARDGLLVPREALVETGEHAYVFVTETGGRFVPRAVTVGAREDARVEILSGLAEGETVVTTGNFLLDSESRLHAAISGAAEPAPGGHVH